MSFGGFLGIKCDKNIGTEGDWVSYFIAPKNDLNH